MSPEDRDLYFESDGARLRYRDEGNGFPVLLIHGWTLDLDMWTFQAESLSGRYRVVRFDRRGFGLSSGEPSPEQDALDAIRLCRHLGLFRVAIIGMSQGARCSLLIAQRAPEAVACLILDGAPEVSLLEETPGAADVPYEEYRELAQREGVAAFRRAWSAHPLAKLRTGDPRARAILESMLERYPGRDLLLSRGPGSPRSKDPLLHDQLPPLLLINGEHDLVTRRRFSDRVAQRLKRVERVEIPNAGHLASLDNPTAYIAAAQSFLDRRVGTSPKE